MSDICPTIPLSCLDPSRIFAGVYNPNCAGFGNPANFQAERAIFSSGFEQLIHNFGVSIGYCVNTFSMEEMNSIYGEHTTMYWLDPIPIKAYIQLEEPSPIYALQGFDSSDTITAYIHIKTFTSTFSTLSVFNEYLVTENNQPILSESGDLIYVGGLNRTYVIEPKAQDKMIIYPLGCDRPNGRGAKIFEVTEVLDQDVSELNPIMGHYVWRIKGVRSEFNSTTNEPRESENNQISDSAFFGKLSSTMFPELTGGLKRYDQFADEEVKSKIFPPSTSGNDGSIYGKYY
jgi:hypothetical protein